MLLVSYISALIFAVASAFSTTYVMFAVLRFFTGFCITGIIIVSAVLSETICMLKSMVTFLKCFDVIIAILCTSLQV